MPSLHSALARRHCPHDAILPYGCIYAACRNGRTTQMDERERDGDTSRLESVTPHENDRFDGRKTRCDVNCDPPDRLDEFGHLLSGTS
jgi:hypothetical protein